MSHLTTTLAQPFVSCVGWAARRLFAGRLLFGSDGFIWIYIYIYIYIVPAGCQCVCAYASGWSVAHLPRLDHFWRLLLRDLHAMHRRVTALRRHLPLAHLEVHPHDDHHLDSRVSWERRSSGG